MVRIAIAGCGQAARIHLARLASGGSSRIVGCSDPDAEAARALAELASASASSSARERGEETVPSFTDHEAMLKAVRPDVLGVFSPHLSHYRAVMDGLQAGCHVFVEKPLSTNPQEAVDIVRLAKGRGRIVAVGHQYRLCPSLIEARRRIAGRTIGGLRMVAALLTQNWLAEHQGSEHSWRFDPRISGGGILADSGDHLVDALLWTTGRVAIEAAAIQDRLESGLDVTTAAAIRLSGEGPNAPETSAVPATLAVSGVSAGFAFKLIYFGERGRLEATENHLEEILEDGIERPIILPESRTSIDRDFLDAVERGGIPCCPADQALDTVRLLEAVARSASTGQIARIR